MLAVIGMNVRPISKAAFIVLVEGVITSHHLDHSPESFQLLRRQTLDVLAGFCLTGFIAELVKRSGRERMFFMALVQRHLQGLTYFDSCLACFFRGRVVVYVLSSV